MKNFDLFQEAQLRQEFREMYKTKGSMVSLQCLYELLRSAEILSDVLLEEMNEKGKESKGLES